MKQRFFLILGITILIIITLVIMFKKITYNFKYLDSYNPGSSYSIKINKINKKLNIKIVRDCSFLDCQPIIDVYEVILTKDEYQKIKTLINNKEIRGTLVWILESIAKNNELIKVDGVDIRYREFGNNSLEDLIEEIK